jgi:hypothetical protein
MTSKERAVATKKLRAIWPLMDQYLNEMIMGKRLGRIGNRVVLFTEKAVMSIEDYTKIKTYHYSKSVGDVKTHKKFLTVSIDIVPSLLPEPPA